MTSHSAAFVLPLCVAFLVSIYPAVGSQPMSAGTNTIDYFSFEELQMSAFVVGDVVKLEWDYDEENYDGGPEFSLTMWYAANESTPSDDKMITGLGGHLGVATGSTSITLDSSLVGGYGASASFYFRGDFPTGTAFSQCFQLTSFKFWFTSPSYNSIYDPEQGESITATWSFVGLNPGATLTLAMLMDDEVIYNVSGSTTVGVGGGNTGFYTFLLPNSNLSSSSASWQLQAIVGDLNFTSDQFIIRRNVTCDRNQLSVAFASIVYRPLVVGNSYSMCGQSWQLRSAVSKGIYHYGIFSNANTSSVVVAFRGTEFTSTADWQNNFRFLYRVDCELVVEGGCGTGLIHRGFARVYNRVSCSVLTDLGQLLEGSTVKDVYITGHSKGAAVATIAGLDFSRQFPDYNQTFRVITFGSPRVGSQAFASAFDDSLGSRNIRFVTSSSFWNSTFPLYWGDDGVTNLPPPTGYSHVSDPTYLGCSGSGGKRWDMGCHAVSMYINALIIQGEGGEAGSGDMSSAGHVTNWLGLLL